MLPEQWLLYASFQYLPPSEKPLDIDALIVMDDHQRKPLAKSRSEKRPPLNVEIRIWVRANESTSLDR